MRNRHLAAIPLAALLLTACASATDATPLTTPTPEPTATATPTPAAGDFAWLNRHDSSFNSGDAYYEMVYRNHGGLLLKTDYATAAQTVVCTVPGCTHDSADCPAWFPGRYEATTAPLWRTARSMCSTRRFSTRIKPGRNTARSTSRLSWTAPTSRPRSWRPTTTAGGSRKAPRRRYTADRRRQDLHRPARRVCGLRV